MLSGSKPLPLPPAAGGVGGAGGVTESDKGRVLGGLFETHPGRRRASSTPLLLPCYDTKSDADSPASLGSFAAEKKWPNRASRRVHSAGTNPGADRPRATTKVVASHRASALQAKTFHRMD